MTNQTFPKSEIAAFYHFGTVAPESVQTLAEELEEEGSRRGLRGLMIFATEGINGTIAGATQGAVTDYLRWISKTLHFPEISAKWSQAEKMPFHRFKVRVREEIVTLGKPEVQPLAARSQTHLSPEEWHKAMTEEDVLVLDTRNWYETRIGKFEGAIDPNLNEFHEFSGYLGQAEIPKDKKILIYCTGGIRCEKAIVEMNNQGFENVYQLDGGILNYLEKFPNQKFEGECFVFDHRVAVDQELKPSATYMLCPHCGQPAEEKISCVRCDTKVAICLECREKHGKRTCSKNCAYHEAVSPGKKGRSQIQGLRFTSPNKTNCS